MFNFFFNFVNNSLNGHNNTFKNEPFRQKFSIFQHCEQYFRILTTIGVKVYYLGKFDKQSLK